MLKRRKIIKYFISKRRRDFHLYGAGWDVPSFILNNTKLSAFWRANKLPGSLPCYKGRVDKKYTVLQKAKFNFCIENCIYPGYISEKLFDSIISGCIPIYWYGSHMENVIPNEIFIDASKFKNTDELIEYSDGLNDTKIAEMRQSGGLFLRQNGLLFTHEHYTQVINSALAAYI